MSAKSRKLEPNQFRNSQSDDFKDTLSYLLKTYDEVILLVWLTRMAGSRDYWVISSLEEYETLTAKLKPGDFVLVFRTFSELWRGTVDASTRTHLKELMEASSEKSFLSICVKSREEELQNAKNYSFCHWCHIDEIQELDEELPDYLGKEVIFMPDPDHRDNSNVYYAYHPDANGDGYSQGAY